MIVVKIELHSAITGKVSNLGQVVIDNIRCDVPSQADYRARAYRKGVDAVAVRGTAIPIRAGEVLAHRRLKLPVQTLVRRALEAMGY